MPILLKSIAVWSIISLNGGDGNDDSKETEGLLRKNGVAYEAGFHPEVFTAQEIAATQHVPGKEIAKVVMVKADGKMLMLVAPASDQIDRLRFGFS